MKGMVNGQVCVFSLSIFFVVFYIFTIYRCVGVIVLQENVIL